MTDKQSKIYTRRGDDGSTSLGGKQRYAKAHDRVEAIGAVDELNSLLGILLAQQASFRLKPVLSNVQTQLFDLGTELAAPQPPRITANMVRSLERELDTIDSTLPPLQAFILPGGSLPASYLHLARTVCRRAERRLCRLASQAGEEVNEQTICYLNRLSDLLFVLARAENAASGEDEILWSGSSTAEDS
jgi:cob(I)alamin adenosyltransferase